MVFWIAVTISTVGAITYGVEAIGDENLQFLSIKDLQKPHMIIATVCLGIGLILFQVDLKHNGEHPIKDLVQKYKPKRGVVICEELKEYESEISEMCKKLSLKGVRVDITSSKSTTASAKNIHFEWPTVIISDWLLSEIYSYKQRHKTSITSCDIICLIIGHELAHIKAGDNYFRRNRKVLALAFLTLVALFFLTSVSLDFIKRLPFASILEAIAFILIIADVAFLRFFINPAYDDIRCLGQINELRADRIGLQISGGTVESFKEMVSLFVSLQQDNEGGSIYSSSLSNEPEKRECLTAIKGFLSRIIKKRFHDKTEDDPHPSWRVRVCEIEKYGARRWRIDDDLRYICRYIRNMRFHHEWRL